MILTPLSFTIFVVFTPILVIVLLALNLILAINKPDAQKLSPYECGMNPLGDAREKFSIQFFLVAILFIVFDLEIVMLFPFAITSELGSMFKYSYWIVMLFIIILTIGFVFEWKIGALKWGADNNNNSISSSNSSTK